MCHPILQVYSTFCPNDIADPDDQGEVCQFCSEYACHDEFVDNSCVRLFSHRQEEQCALCGHPDVAADCFYGGGVGVSAVT